MTEPTAYYYAPIVEIVCTEAPVDTVTTVHRNELRLSKPRSNYFQSQVAWSQKKAINDVKDLHETF